MPAHLHNQYPTSEMGNNDYETALVHLTDQLGAAVVADYPEGEAHKAASDALANEFGTTPDQTVLDWIKAACRRIGADPARISGL